MSTSTQTHTKSKASSKKDAKYFVWSGEAPSQLYYVLPTSIVTDLKDDANIHKSDTMNVIIRDAEQSQSNTQKSLIDLSGRSQDV